MDRKPAAVDIIRFFTEEVEELAVYHADEEVEGAVCIRHDQEQHCLPVTQGIQLQFVVHSHFPDLIDVKGRESCSGADKYRFCRFAGS